MRLFGWLFLDRVRGWARESRPGRCRRIRTSSVLKRYSFGSRTTWKRPDHADALWYVPTIFTRFGVDFNARAVATR